LGNDAARFFAGWMPFQSPNQQCQTLKGGEAGDEIPVAEVFPQLPFVVFNAAIFSYSHR